MRNLKLQRCCSKQIMTNPTSQIMKTTNTEPTNRSAISEVKNGLGRLLANTYSLLAATHHAHWNVEGKGFFHLHAAFEEQYNELFAASDEIAERVRALGAYTPGGLRRLAELSSIQDPEEPGPGKEFVASLAEAHEVVISDAKKLRDTCETAGDLETQDLVIARIQVHEKTLWMLRSHLK